MSHGSAAVLHQLIIPYYAKLDPCNQLDAYFGQDPTGGIA